MPGGRPPRQKKSRVATLIRFHIAIMSAEHATLEDPVTALDANGKQTNGAEEGRPVDVLDELIVTHNLQSGRSFYVDRLRMIGVVDLSKSQRDDLLLHLKTFDTMFKAHSEDPYDDD